MPVFSYKGFDSRGKAVSGVKDADNLRALRAKIISALFYPIAMTVIGAGIMAILMISVVPKVTAIFADTGKALPWNTQILIGVSGVVGSWWGFVVLLAIVGLVIL